MTRITLEVCVDDAAGLSAAVKGGADRVELCAALALGGLTPSPGLISRAAEGPLPAMVMIRPRAGDFCWNRDDLRLMRAEIAMVRAAGLAGVVIGASLPDGRLDPQAMADLVDAAGGMDITLHRAIDLAPDVDEALDLCARLGIRRVLSSGGATTAVAGLRRLAAMQRPGLVVMPGGGVSVATLPALSAALPLTEVHASCSLALPPAAHPGVAAFGFQPPGQRATDAGQVRALREALDALQLSRPSGWTSS